MGGRDREKSTPASGKTHPSRQRWVVFPRPHLVCPHLCPSLQGRGPDPEMVPALRGSPGDEAAVHLEHLPVHRVCRAARPGQGALGGGAG